MEKSKAELGESRYMVIGYCNHFRAVPKQSKLRLYNYTSQPLDNDSGTSNSATEVLINSFIHELIDFR